MRITENSPQRLVLKDRSWWISWLCFAAAAFMLYQMLAHDASRDALFAVAFLAVFGLVFLRSSDVVFDKATGLCDLRELKVIRVKRMSIRFSDIEDVQVDIEPMDTSQVESCRLSLKTATGIIPLTDVYQPDLKRYDAMRDAVMDALSRPASANPQPDPVRRLVQEGRTLDAVALLRRRDGLDLVTAQERVQEMKKGEP